MVVTLSFRTNIPKGERKMPVQVPSKWDKEVDVVVLGTGGAALTAAIAAADGVHLYSYSKKRIKSEEQPLILVVYHGFLSTTICRKQAFKIIVKKRFNLLND